MTSQPTATCELSARTQSGGRAVPIRRYRAEGTLCLLSAQDLAACQHTLIGDETLGMKGISGGERRRVGVGLQARPAPHPCATPLAITGVLYWRSGSKAAH